MKKLLISALAAVTLTGCASWSSTRVEQNYGDVPTLKVGEKTHPQDIILSDQDMPDRKYQPLGDIVVNVNKTTIFHPSPTPAMVNEKLREQGAELGADAVILIRYGNVGISGVSWGTLEGKGRAIKFTK
ncbi:hypothetical protein HS961_09040 [Comamonas piscis]|uniref:Heavy metal-binding domain-containing protein n=1 Tax=Comamonas piscis TaxID=1562974 RepID=A0A7G5EG49_9BURK|nr:hypothetical protein [Comamonas piscis]QMV72974.1 hypothetical protein HS961_09040 [Comamonas piscis]WSO35755.1 hypothetical protein VUJ63_09065 [Comamonas piscis]